MPTPAHVTTKRFIAEGAVLFVFVVDFVFTQERNVRIFPEGGTQIGSEGAGAPLPRLWLMLMVVHFV